MDPTKRQPTVVQHGLWLEDVLGFLRNLADAKFDATGVIYGAGELLEEYDRLLDKDDRRR